MILDLTDKRTRIFNENLKAYYDPDCRIIVNRGGTRSSKTSSMAEMIIALSFTENNEEYLVTSDTLPNLKAGALKDIKAWMGEPDPDTGVGLGVEHLFHHHQTGKYFKNKQTGTIINYRPYDNEQDVKGAKYKLIFMNEANRQPFGVFKQLIMRTPGKIFLDFNPDDEFVWINTEIEQKRKDFKLIKSSYLDNHFLPDVIVKEIEYLKEQDKSYWQIYGLGEYGTLRNKVYDNYEVISDEAWENAYYSDKFYGLDFGYVHPTALIEERYHENSLYLKEIIHESYLKPDDIIDKIDKAKIGHTDPIYCDHAYPSHISQISNVGYNAIKANKKVNEGINFMRRFKIYINQSSVNLIKEFNNYKYREDKDGKVIEEPVKFMDDGLDAARYGAFSHLQHVFVR